MSTTVYIEALCDRCQKLWLLLSFYFYIFILVMLNWRILTRYWQSMKKTNENNENSFMKTNGYKSNKNLFILWIQREQKVWVTFVAQNSHWQWNVLALWWLTWWLLATKWLRSSPRRWKPCELHEKCVWFQQRCEVLQMFSPWWEEELKSLCFQITGFFPPHISLQRLLSFFGFVLNFTFLC